MANTDPGWTPEFRRWLSAYRSGVRGPVLERLDRRAIAAGDKRRARGRRHVRCPECGRRLA